MKYVFAMLAMAVMATPVWAKQDCEELRDRIAAKLESKKIASYSLEIIDAKQPHKGGRVVGTCDLGSKKIIYTKG